MKKKNIIGIVIAIILIILFLNPSILPVSPETVQKLQELKSSHFMIGGNGKVAAAHLLMLIPAFAIVWLVYTVIKLILDYMTKKDPKLITITQLLTGALRYLAVIIGFFWFLSILGVDTTAIVAGAGIIGLIVGFGAQSLIEDVITGLFIIFEHQYEVGDIIILDDFRGVVRSIGVRTTVIEDVGRNLKVVNNSDIRNFQNRSRNMSVALCDVAVAYDTDLLAMEEMLKRELPEMHNELYISEPRYLGVEELADSGINLRFAADCLEEDIFFAQRALRRDIRVLFAKEGIEIPFPQVVVHQED